MYPSALQLLGFQAPQAQMEEGAGIKHAPKLSLARWGCACKILSRSVQGFGFPLDFHIPTDKHLYVHFDVYRCK